MKVVGTQKIPPVYESWHGAAAYAQGQGHAQAGEPCQDYAAFASSNDVYVVCLADGAGTRRQSQHGAQAIVEGTTRYLTHCFDRLFSMEDKEKVAHIVKLLRNILTKAARENKCRPRDLASTFLAVAVKEDRFIAMHVGDGVIGASCKDGLKVISMPENGEYANTTVFTTAADLSEHVRIQSGNVSSVAGFILMSDGASDTLHVHNTDKLAPAVGKLMIYCAEHPDEIGRDLQETLEEMMVPKTTDDCSVALLVSDSPRLHAYLGEDAPIMAAQEPDDADDFQSDFTDEDIDEIISEVFDDTCEHKSAPPKVRKMPQRKTPPPPVRPPMKPPCR